MAHDIKQAPYTVKKKIAMYLKTGGIAGLITSLE